MPPPPVGVGVVAAVFDELKLSEPLLCEPAGPTVGGIGSGSASGRGKGSGTGLLQIGVAA